MADEQEYDKDTGTVEEKIKKIRNSEKVARDQIVNLWEISRDEFRKYENKGKGDDNPNRALKVYEVIKHNITHIV